MLGIEGIIQFCGREQQTDTFGTWKRKLCQIKSIVQCWGLTFCYYHNLSKITKLINAIVKLCVVIRLSKEARPFSLRRSEITNAS